MEQLLDQCGGRECAALAEVTLGVALIQPVDIYLQAERAVKYGVLFVGLTFAAFFLFELFKRLAIHPVGRRVTVQSDNPAYGDLPDCSLDEIECIGRVIWAGRKIA